MALAVMAASDYPIFFVHLMKTGGTTLKRMIKAGMPESALYPSREDGRQRFRAHMDVDYLLNIPRQRTRHIKFFSGHFPYIATELIDTPVHSITLLRDPVARVISHLKQSQETRSWHRWSPELANKEHPTLQDIYDDELLRERFFVNHQLRMFAMTKENYATSLLESFTLGDSSLEQACEHLGRVTCLGILEQFDNFIDNVTHTFGIRTRERKPQNTAHTTQPVPEELKQRIAHDNQLEIAFYSYAHSLCHRRHVMSTS